MQDTAFDIMEGLQDVGLDLLDDQDDDQHDDRLRQTAVQRSNHHRDDTRGQGTQNRHECREERDNTDRDGEGHTQKERASAMPTASMAATWICVRT